MLDQVSVCETYVFSGRSDNAGQNETIMQYRWIWMLSLPPCSLSQLLPSSFALGACRDAPPDCSGRLYRRGLASPRVLRTRANPGLSMFSFTVATCGIGMSLPTV